MLRSPLRLTEEQNENLYILKLKAAAYKLEAESLRREWENMREREKTVHNSVLADGVFIYEEDSSRGEKGERITDENAAFLMSEEDFITRYLPAVQKKWVDLYGLHYEVNYTPVYEYHKAYLDALKDYRKTAVEFLKILGKNEAADEFLKILDGYIPEKFAKQLDEITDQFLFGSMAV